MTITTLLTTVGEVMTASLGFFGDVLDFAVANPIILLSIVLPIVYALVKFAIKLVKTGGKGKRR